MAENVTDKMLVKLINTSIDKDRMITDITGLAVIIRNTSNTLFGMLLSEEGVIEASDGSKHKSSGDFLFTSVLSNPSIELLFCLTIVCSYMQNLVQS